MNRPFRILVTGSRDWLDEQQLRLALIEEWTPRLKRGVVIVHGSAGASHCADAAEKAGIPVRRFLS